MNVAAVIVTFNRSKLLCEAIKAIQSQTYPLDAIYIVDNASTDNTEIICQELAQLDDHIQYQRLPLNTGGAGGFNFGIKWAFQQNHDSFWIMDDDTIPHSDALQKLVESVQKPAQNQWGFVCSNVLWTDGSQCRMNLPHVKEIPSLQTNSHLIEIDRCSFVSVLISRAAVAQCGLPIKEFFIWVDDAEFTNRISQKFPCYYVPESIVVHKMISNQAPNIFTDQNDRVDRYFYDFRNSFYYTRHISQLRFLRFSKKTLFTIVKLSISSSPNRFKKIKVVIKGYLAGIRFHPDIEFA